MILNAHSQYSLRYGTLSIEQLVEGALKLGHEQIALTDINNSTAIPEFLKLTREKNIHGVAGIEFRNNERLLYLALAKNSSGIKEMNELLTRKNLSQDELPERPELNNCYIVYPFPKGNQYSLKENEYVGISPWQLTKIAVESPRLKDKYLALYPVFFGRKEHFLLHQKLRAIDCNALLSQLSEQDRAHPESYFVSAKELEKIYSYSPILLENTKKVLLDCKVNFDFTSSKNKKHFTNNPYDDKLLLEKLAYEGMKSRYGNHNKEALSRVKKELEIIDRLHFSSYFLITWDIIRYSLSRGFYHVGRGSGANSVVAYCLRITDVCPLELDLYFERFLNPKRKSPPDFDIDYSWKERDEVLEYIFRRYGSRHTALLGTINTFKDRSILRELGKIYGLPKEDIDRLIKYPNSPLNENELCREILQHFNSIENFPNMRSIHAGGVLVSEEPITCYSALDLPPKGLPTVQFDMYTAEEIGFEKLDILSQRGIGHIKESAEIIRENKNEKIDLFDIEKFKKDEKIKAQLKSGDTIGCFYVESPAMRGLLKKLKCSDYITLVAASSIIRPGVSKSGMMKAYIERFHHPEKINYLHPVMKEQLKETYGVMVYQEDVLKIGHHFGGLDLADADVLRRLMSGKNRGKHHLIEIEEKFFTNCKTKGYPEEISREVWRQIESFAGYSFSKAHSASFAVESFQSLYLKTYYPLEFMVAVINNFGGFYKTWVYVNELRKAGGNVCLPCVNYSRKFTRLIGKEAYLGFIHMKNIENETIEKIETERESGGEFSSMENFIRRTKIGLEQLILLIRINALRFTKKNKRELLWESHLFYSESQRKQKTNEPSLFESNTMEYKLPELKISSLEDAYDEIELLEFPVSMNEFELLKQKNELQFQACQLLQQEGKTVAITGNYVCHKPVKTVKNELMGFGTFLDKNGDFFDTVHFPNSTAAINLGFKGKGIYYLEGKVSVEFGFPIIEVKKMEKLPLQEDPRIA